MNDDFRQRVFLPIVMPLAVIAGFVGFAFALSRVLLAVPEAASTAVALAMASYVLAIAALVASRPRITSRALSVGVTIGMVAVIAAGTVAGASGMRPLEEEETAAVAEGEETGAPTVGENTFVAVDIAWEDAPEQVTAGEVALTLVNEGAGVHNLVIEELGEEPVAEAQPGETVEGDTTLKPGTYTYYCSIPGHREAGMEGTLTAKK